MKFGTLSDFIGSTSSVEKKEKENKTVTRTITEYMSESNISDTSALILPLPNPSRTKSLILDQNPKVELKELPKRNMKFRKPMVLLMKIDNRLLSFIFYDLLTLDCYNYSMN